MVAKNPNARERKKIRKKRRLAEKRWHTTGDAHDMRYRAHRENGDMDAKTGGAVLVPASPGFIGGGAYVLLMGKHKGKTIAEIGELDDGLDYLHFLLDWPRLWPATRKAIRDYLDCPSHTSGTVPALPVKPDPTVDCPFEPTR